MKITLITKNGARIILLMLILTSLILLILAVNKYNEIKQINLHEQSTGYINLDTLKFDFTKEQIKESFIKETLKKYKDKKVMALTFDDGPSKYTLELLDTLDEYNVKATFFLIGSKIPGNEAIVKEIKKRGHIVASHGYSHKIFTKLDDEQISEELEFSIKYIEEITNEKLLYIRLPYGISNERVLSNLESYNLIPVLWHIDSLDWKLKNKNKIAKRVVSKAKDKAIILLHDSHKFSVQSVPLILDKLQEEYSFVDLDELNILNNY